LCVRACVRRCLYSYGSGAVPAFCTWYCNMTPCSLVGWCQGLDEFTASIFRDKKRLVIYLAMLLRGFAVRCQHFGEPYCLHIQGFSHTVFFLWFISLCCPLGGYQLFGGRSCVCPEGKSHFTLQFWQCFPSVRPSVRASKSFLFKAVYRV
jgi:hypothetical protein